MQHRRKRLKWILWIAALAGLILAARRLPIVAWLEQVADPLRDMGALGVAVYASVYFVAGMFCLPCMPLTLAAGYIFSTTEGVIAVHSAATLAAACGFLLGRALGRAHAAEYLRNSKRLHYLDEAIAHEGWKIVGLLRTHAIPFGASNYLFGMTRVDFWHYLLATTVAMLPGHLIYVRIGTLGRHHLSGQADIGLLQWAAPALGFLSACLLTIVLTRIVRKHGALKPQE